MLQITGVSRRFGDVTALSEISLEIRQGEFFALLGPSGCGKTTLLRILAGFEAPDSGTVTLDGEDLLGQAAHRRPVNLMFQSYALFPHMTVAKNVAYGLEREKLRKAEIRERVEEVLEKVGLAAMAKRKPQQLSGGQRQRVALARAIVKRPRLLLLDEPLSALDKKVRAEMQLELKRLQNEVGITFVVVTHDQEEAMSLADRIAVFSAGKVEQVDAPVTLYERPRTPFVADFVGANNLFEGKVCADGLSSDGLGVLPGLSDLEEGTSALLAVRPERLRLISLGHGPAEAASAAVAGEEVEAGEIAEVEADAEDTGRSESAVDGEVADDAADAKDAADAESSESAAAAGDTEDAVAAEKAEDAEGAEGTAAAGDTEVAVAAEGAESVTAAEKAEDVEGTAAAGDTEDAVAAEGAEKAEDVEGAEGTAAAGDTEVAVAAEGAESVTAAEKAEDAEVEADAGDTAGAVDPVAGEGVLRGEVADVSFYGGISHISVLVAGRPVPVLVATQGATQVQAGSPVALTWAPEDGVLIPQ
ncbi:ATP-binding cassette domain-containing protein [Streptosporangium canum]|uniref:polyamine ABC transporter ATP-binding protein n=1 Tax=Streptosporangium canum TaxID=324952 RepID=UPI0033A8ACD5